MFHVKQVVCLALMYILNGFALDNQLSQSCFSHISLRPPNLGNRLTTETIFSQSDVLDHIADTLIMYLE